MQKISSLRIFYQIEICEKIRFDEEIILDNNVFGFYKYIEIYAERTGAHIAEGDIYYKNINFPKSLENHKVYDYILKVYLESDYFILNNSKIIKKYLIKKQLKYKLLVYN